MLAVEVGGEGLFVVGFELLAGGFGERGDGG